MFPWCCGRTMEGPDFCDQEKGFFPALAKGEEETCKNAHSFERRQAVDVTLEHAYDDWCAGQLAAGGILELEMSDRPCMS